MGGVESLESRKESCRRQGLAQRKPRSRPGAVTSSDDVCTHTDSGVERVDAAGKGAGRAVREAANGMYRLVSRDEEWIRGHLWLGCNLDQDHGPPAIMHVTRSSQGGRDG